MSRLLLLPILLASAMTLSGCASSRMMSDLERIGFEWVAIPAGSFMMGDTWEGISPDEIPAHRVVVGNLYVSRFETTFEQYDWYTDREELPRVNPDQVDRGRRAVNMVTWQEAADFCMYIGGRLPTEREWEYAAAGGAEKQLYPGTDDKEAADDYIRHRENALAEPFMVGSKLPNHFGLFDMGGNVAEWVSAYYERYPAEGQDIIWHDLDQFDMRVVRGGGFGSELETTRTFRRSGTLQFVTTPNIGFRCVKDR